jgi:hypothetical protein
MVTTVFKSRKVALLAVAVVVMGTGGTALAVTASHGSAIHACAKRGTGELRLASRCRSNERPVSWNVQAATGGKGYAYVTASKALLPSSSLGVAEMTRSADGDYYCFDLTFTPVNVVVSAGLNGSYIVGDVVGPSTLSSDQAAALCGKPGADAVVYFPGGLGGFYASFS